MITSADNPAIKTLRKLKTRKYRRKLGLFLVDDADIFREALACNLVLEQVYASRELSILQDMAPVMVKESVLSGVSDTPSFSGFIGVFHLPGEGMSSEASHVLVLDGIQDPGNVGAIFRSAVQFDVRTVLMTDDCADAYSAKALRAAKGATFHLQLVRSVPETILDGLKQRNISLYGADTHDGVSLNTIRPVQPFALVMGSEGGGLRPAFRNACHTRVTIPGTGRMESLNVGVAAGIILYRFYSTLSID